MRGAGGQRDVVGIGNAIVDVLVQADDEVLERHGLIKGTMALVDFERAELLYEELGPGVACSGGSAANTMAGLAALGGSGAYIGKVGDDTLGTAFRSEIRAVGVAYDTPPAAAGLPTGRCVVLVTPDAQRTMSTYLGASSTLGPGDLDPATIASATITFLEGYLWDLVPAQQALQQAAEIAHRAGRKVAMTLSDPFCVDRHREAFRALVDRHVDILLANELELISLYSTGDLDEALDELRGRVQVAAVTRSAQGSIILAGNARVEVAAETVGPVVDTTGAGDLYASGFLFGLARGLDLPTCGRIASLAAGEVISHFGARPATSLKELIEREA